MVYLDHAATSYPKSERVVEAMSRCAHLEAGNPGRSGHRLALSASRVVDGVRLAVSRLMGVGTPSRVVLTQNGTDALNLAIHGVLSQRESTGAAHAVTTALEHNSVLRPLATLEEAGLIQVTRVGFDAHGFVSADDVESVLRPETRMVVMTHASNVLGSVQDVATVGAMLQQRGVLFCVDAAQTAGVVPIDMERMGIDLLAFPGHKGLGGPTGTGCLCLSERAADRVSAMRQGGTGGDSRSRLQPKGLPERLESGTPNVIGLAGLLAALEGLETGVLKQRWSHERQLRARVSEGLTAIAGVRVLEPAVSDRCVGVLSFVSEMMDASTLSGVLDSSFEIAVRGGLHCSPAVHEQLGLLPDGAVRVSVGPETTVAEVDALIEAVGEIHGS